jgi:hypothetical protein
VFALRPSASRTPQSRSRGQALIEFAIILPLLVILLVMAIDAGRLFFGWVALQNASRIGADYAASHASAWDGTPNLQDLQNQQEYEDLVQGDLNALGCQSAAVPAPNFDPDGDGTEDFSDGALLAVDLACPFPLLTPLAEAFLGRPLVLHSSSQFAINRTIASGLPPGAPPPTPAPTPPPGVCVAPDFVTGVIRVNNAQGMWTAAGFTTTIVVTRPPNGNYDMNSQSPLGPNQAGSCSTVETVGP